jgi:ABC-2 type transport system ATP-binding protein
VLETGRVIASAPLAELVAAHAQGAIEIELEGPAPESLARAGVRAGSDGRFLLGAEHPERELARLLAQLDDERARLRSVAIVRPSLEAAYLALTGRRDAEPEIEGPR